MIKHGYFAQHTNLKYWRKHHKFLLNPWEVNMYELTLQMEENKKEIRRLEYERDQNIKLLERLKQELYNLTKV